MRHRRRPDHTGRVIEIRLGLDLVHVLLLEDRVTTQSSFVLGRNLARLVLKVDLPIVRRWNDGRRLNLCVDEVQSHSTLAGSIRLPAVLAVWHRLITLQMSLSARQTSRPHSLRPTYNNRGFGGKSVPVDIDVRHHPWSTLHPSTWLG